MSETESSATPSTIDRAARDGASQPDFPEQQQFEAARAALAEAQRRLAQARALVARPGLPWMARREAMAKARIEAVATRLAVVDFCEAAARRNAATAQRRR